MAHKAQIVKRAVTQDGTPIRLQKRGDKFDVIRLSGITWWYVDKAKAVTEQSAENTFYLLTLQSPS